MQRGESAREQEGGKGSAEAAQKVNVQGANLFEVHGPRSTSELTLQEEAILPNLLVQLRAKGPAAALGLCVFRAFIKHNNETLPS